MENHDDDRNPSTEDNDVAPEMDDAGKSTKRKKPPLPRVPRVFGKYGAFILIAPFVTYLGGINVAAYLERSRAHACVKQQTSIAAGVLEHIESQVDSAAFATRNGEGAADQFKKDLGMRRLKRILTSGEEVELEPLQKAATAVMEYDQPAQAQNVAFFKLQVERLIQLLEWEHEGKERDIFSASAKWHSQEGIVSDEGQEDASEVAESPASVHEWFPNDGTWYPSIYVIVIALTGAMILIVSPGYFRAPFSISYWSVIVGVAGIVVWLGLWWLDKNLLGLGSLFGSTAREAFDPFKELKDNPTWLWQFLAIRFLGLVVIVPITEEFFLRGFLMRYIDDPDWDEIPLGFATRLSVIGIAVYALVSHPSEPLAAVVWFSMVTWLYVKTKSIWDCVVAHAITNLLLGLYVIKTGTWELW